MSSNDRPADIVLPATKVHAPALRMAQIDRPGLEARLGAALSRYRLILISAPAGFGKTTTLVRALAGVSPHIAAFWISIDEGDDLPRLLFALELALEAADIPWRTSVQGMLEIARQDQAGQWRVADLIADALAASEVDRGVIVFDDTHRLHDPTVFGWLERLVERLPERWTIVLSTREKPPLALPRLRLSGALGEFGADDLRFTLDEFTSLAETHGRREDAESLRRIWSKMAGWPAGCELALQAGTAATDLAGLEGPAFDFLSSEVLAHLPEDLVAFLTECSILTELSEPVCQAVTGRPDAGMLLEEVVRRGLFASELDPSRGVLRLHDLFRDYLLARLRRTSTREQFETLLTRAAAAEATPERRISYLVQAGRFVQAEAELSALCSVLLPQGEIERVSRLVHALPESFIAQSAELSYTLGLCESCYPRWQQAGIHMANAARLFAQAGATERCQRSRAYELVARFGEARTAEAMTLLAELEQEPLDAGTRALCALAGYLLSRVSGTVEQEMRYFDRMFESLVASGDPVIWNQCGLHIYLGLQQGMRGRAERYATGALAIAGDRDEMLRDSALSMRIWHLLLSGKYPEAAAIVGEVEGSQAWHNKPYSVRGSIQIARSILGYAQGDPAALRTAADRLFGLFEGREGQSWAYWRGLSALFFGRFYAALEDWDALDQCCERLDNELRILDMPYLRLGQAYLAVLQSLRRPRDRVPPELEAGITVSAMRGDYLALAPELAALSALARARALDYAVAWQRLSDLIAALSASGELLRLTFLGGVRLKELANIPFAGGKYDAQRNTLLSLVDRLDEARQTLRSQPKSDRLGLSLREMEILERLAGGDSNKTIARDLLLSPHTVKRHVANILDKLGVRSRGQAAAQFRKARSA
ncbi:LuxR C-terminal-related transcriptional regulator [uncultured Devosia sp.]|uniref:LuxR C-terminal-related transcriptional regulator n=1 Tax=uncultured Devosia sp. TaxID=211434 RepID=UPI002614FBC8|nr:LuxR C-terminal-related transcriptional regulator [uncultured Devosia sp.]